MKGRISMIQEDRRWTWAYEQGEIRLASNHDYGSRGEAVEAARRAFPDAEIAGTDVIRTAEEDRTSQGFLGFVLMTMAVWRFSRREKRAQH